MSLLGMNLPAGYRYASTYAGIRKVKQDDLALIVSDSPANAAAVFTTNVVQAAPVRLARQHLKSSRGKLSAVLVNAGNANCATRTGERVALITCRQTAKRLRIPVAHVLPASTGVIGVELDPQLITAALPPLNDSLSADNFEAVARAIMTTDTRMKVACEEVKLSRGTVHIVGMAKGSGMIQPNMATTLAFVMTDAIVPVGALRSLLTAGIASSFNSLTVDGDMSTNDTLALLANGASGVKPAQKEIDAFQERLTALLESLAEQIAADGEGARKLIIVRTLGFRTEDDARRVARAIANSPLVKTAIAGSDPNWGRILVAAGNAGVAFDPADVDVFLQGVPVCQAGLAAEFDEADMKAKLDEPQVQIRLLHRGKRKGQARIFTCDLTEGYIQINGSYRT